MPGWTLVDSHPTRGRTFHRPLKGVELVFTHKSPLHRPQDISRHLELRLLNVARGTNLFSDANITRAWVSTKRRYPLAGAILKRQDVGAGHSWGTGFVVHESHLSVLCPHEIVFGQAADVKDAEKQITAILHGPNPLSDELLVQLYVFREANSDKAREDILHVFVMMSHCLGDEMASRTIVRCWLDTLARGGGPDPEPAQMPLEDRLAMEIPVVELQPVQSLTPARRRWRRAAAAVILQLKTEKSIQLKPLESLTLPHRLGCFVSSSVADTGLLETLLTHTQSKAVIVKCRQHKITFGNAYPVLAQVAMTRVLYRRYLRGDISEEEWAHRRRLPFVNAALINMRPYQDKEWFEKGGGGELALSVTGFSCHLPFTTLGRTDSEHDMQHTLSNGVPPFSDLLTFDRFLHRVGLVKKQAVAHLSHPLFFEVNEVINEKIIQYMQPLLQQSGNQNEEPKRNEAYQGSSLGNMDLTFPFEYPLPPSHPLSPYSPVSHPCRAGYVASSPSGPIASEADMNPTISVEHQSLHLYVRGGQLYLSASTWRGQMKMSVYYDQRAFEEEVVREWLDEVREAVLWYLG